MGCTAEQTSCVKPGRVSSADRKPPPAEDLASAMRTVNPSRCKVMAAARPLGPLPTTTISKSFFVRAII